MNPILVAITGKGLSHFWKRGISIAGRYGVTPSQLDDQLAHIVAVSQRFACGATLPVTSVVLQRNPRVIRKYQAQGIEFAVHGYRHLDHSQLSASEQREHLHLARRVFEHAGIRAQGFRGPYLRRSHETWTILEELGFKYDSSQSLAWDVLNGRETQAYRRAISFYGARPANDYPALPNRVGQLVSLPYSLPDDEALVERLEATPTVKVRLWRAILQRTYELGELFTLGLHPERTTACLEALTATLAEARTLTPAVWIARLDEIAAWWMARFETTVTVARPDEHTYRITAAGPREVTVLARGVEVQAPTVSWADGYWRVQATSFTVHSLVRPFIGLSPTASPALSDFLRQQGYIIEVSSDRQAYACYLDHTGGFSAEQQRVMLARVEREAQSLVRLGRWPDGARSALSITGDIDALTLWDYGLRLVGR